MKKKLTALIMVFALLISLTSCQPQMTQTDIHINSKPAEKTTLSFFASVSAKHSSIEAFRDLTLEYNKSHSNIEITFDGMATADGYDQFLEERLDTDGAVDIFTVNAESVKSIAKKGQFYDLSSLETFGMLSENAKEQALIGGKAYTIPLDMAVYVMDVNVSLLERHGLEVPRNYDEFLHCCKVLKEQGVTPISLNRWYAMTVPVMVRSLYPIYQSENREELIAGLNSGEIKIGDYMIEGLRMFEMFLNEGYFGDNLVMEEVDALKANTKDEEDFINGRTAFRFFPVTDLVATEMENGDTSILAGIPFLPDGSITMPSISTRLCVNANSRFLKEAVAFVDEIASQRVEVIRQKNTNQLSPFRQTEKTDADSIWEHSLLNLMESGHQIPIEDMNVHFGYWDNTRALCLKMIGGMSAQEAADEFNRIQLEELRAYAEK